MLADHSEKLNKMHGVHHVSEPTVFAVSLFYSYSGTARIY